MVNCVRPRQRRSSRDPRTWVVPLNTPTGSVDYELPLAIDETYRSTRASTFLSPSGDGRLDAVQIQCRLNRLLALPISHDDYRIPKFQIDEPRKTIRTVVAHANQLLQCNEDSWGALDWWYSEDEAFDGQRPVDLLATGALTEELVGPAVTLGRRAMD
jgi:hypothetical protein